MLFSSIPFLYYFLPLVLIVYFIMPERGKNLVLLIASLIFYGWGEPKYLSMMLVSIGAAYLLGLLIEKDRNRPVQKVWMGISTLFSIFMLGYFKYADFFIENFNALTGLSIPLLKIVLPIGISFYTFQLLSYTIDVYRGDTPAQKNLISLAAYVSLFPQLIAGPIVRYSDVAAQLEKRTHSLSMISEGIQRFILGLGKKVLLANALGELCGNFRASGDLSVLYFWMYAAAFMLQIYFDFSGYSDMAIGLGKIFGFDFKENFDHPYASSSITEFWRRWHMSLGSWFRDYVYIPLGGNHVSKPRWFFNIFAVWMLTGLWHGASWNFIIWGLLFAALLIIEKLKFLKILEYFKKHHFLNILPHIYVILLVMFSFVIFNAGNMTQAFNDLGGMFGVFHAADDTLSKLPLTSVESLYYLKSYRLLLILSAVGATPLAAQCSKKLRSCRTGRIFLDIAEPWFLAGILIAVTAYLVDGSFNPFLYFRF